MSAIHPLERWVSFGTEIEQLVSSPPLAGAQIEVPPELVEAAQVLKFHFERGFRTYRGLTLLTISGFPEDAMVLLRTLLEVLFEMAFIAKHPEDARLYLDHGTKTEVEWWQRMRALGPNDFSAAAGFSEAAAVSEISDTGKPLIDHKVRKGKRQKRAWHHKFVGVRDRAIEGGVVPFFYDLAYSLCSRYSHGSGDWMRELARGGNPASRISQKGDAGEGALAVMFASLCVLEQLEIICGCLALPTDGRLQALRTKCQEISADEWAQAAAKYV